MIKYKSSMFASRDVCIDFGKKMLSHLRCWFYLYMEFTRHLDVESAVPAIFPSYAPTFFTIQISINPKMLHFKFEKIDWLIG